ncbi:Aste57867_2249 [Aphanomyces stellatus]|uniref:Calmodulin n=1 Tax=Aphanomyces stellatus TaxID=120398 RepID=A0A485KBG7_9STRA|nr:hypothetical protein As57867_002244 [Aphanomyces stellatus]VFT79452.1 Aste57867_2249 [Aphanomyces stellatus]
MVERKESAWLFARLAVFAWWCCEHAHAQEGEITYTHYILSTRTLLAGDGSVAADETEVDNSHARFYTAMSSIVTISTLIFLSIVFETGAEKLRESTEDINMPFINTIFGELTTLGFIGSVLFVMSKSGYLSQVSKTLFGKSKALELQESIEELHMALFLFVIVFLLLCIALLKFGVKVQHEFREFEVRAPYVQVVVADYCFASEPPATWWDYFSWHRYKELAKRKREMVYVSLRRRFVDFRSNHPDPMRAHEMAKDFQLEKDTRFPFNEYLTIISGEVMARLIRIDAVTWVALEIFIVLLVLVCWSVGPDNEVYVFLAAGVFLVALNQLVYIRIRNMRQLLTPPILFKKAERHRANPIWRSQRKLPPLLPPRRDPMTYDEEATPLLEVTDKSPLSDFVPPYIHDLPNGGVDMDTAQLQDAQKALLGGNRNGVKLALFSTRLVFLFTALHLCVVILRTSGQIIERPDMAIATKLVCAALLALPSCIVTSMSIVIARNGLYAFNVEALKAPRVVSKVMRIVKARQTLRTLRFIAEMKFYLRELDDDDDDDTDDDSGDNDPLAALQRPPHMAAVAPMASKQMADDHATPSRSVSGKAGSTRHRKIHRMKELPSFHLDDLDDWDAMSPRTRTLVEVPMSPIRDPSAGSFSFSPTDQSKDQYEAETERREINSIFCLIDKDKSGKILTDEMQDFLRQISPDMTNDQIARIMTDLDKSDAGGVLFADFEQWCRQHIHQLSSKHNKQQLIKEVFRMIDTDKSGFITVDEFIAIFKSLGQSLDHEDVRELVYQVDRNNDGKIDLEEFQKMLQKHAV